MMVLNLKKRIILGAYVIYCIRKLRIPFVTESITFAVLLVTLFYFVSIPNVFINMLDSESFHNYLIMAFSNTNLLVQSIIALAAVTMLLFARNLATHTIFKQRSA